MRGQDAQQTAMFSYVSLEERLPTDHPFAGHPRHGGSGAFRLEPTVFQVVPADGPRIDSARAAAAGTFVFSCSIPFAASGS